MGLICKLLQAAARAPCEPAKLAISGSRDGHFSRRHQGVAGAAVAHQHLHPRGIAAWIRQERLLAGRAGGAGRGWQASLRLLRQLRRPQSNHGAERAPLVRLPRRSRLWRAGYSRIARRRLGRRRLGAPAGLCWLGQRGFALSPEPSPSRGGQPTGSRGAPSKPSGSGEAPLTLARALGPLEWARRWACWTRLAGWLAQHLPANVIDCQRNPFACFALDAIKSAEVAW